MANPRPYARRFASFASALFAILFASTPRTAMAEAAAPCPGPPRLGATSGSDTPVRDGSPETAPSTPTRPPLPPAINVADMEAMADLVSASPAEVAQHLWLDPGLAPFALRAVEQARKRVRTGKILTILGWTIVGIGLTTAFDLYIAAQPGLLEGCDESCERSRTEGEHTAFMVGAGSLAAGLALAIPGMVVLARTSDAERQAILRFRQQDARRSAPPPRPLAGTGPVAPRGRQLALPLLSFSF